LPGSVFRSADPYENVFDPETPDPHSTYLGKSELHFPVRIELCARVGIRFPGTNPTLVQPLRQFAGETIL
jgi:hypothetical protein